jgi:hypothetical protein
MLEPERNSNMGLQDAPANAADEVVVGCSDVVEYRHQRLKT